MTMQTDAVKKTAGKRTSGKKSPKKTAAPVTDTGGRYFSRDESWLKFNQRVLEEAQDETNPLLERVKFLAITASNLDEFVEIRVAGILQRIEDGTDQGQGPDEGGLTPEERLVRLSKAMRVFVDEQYKLSLIHI